MTNDDLAKLVDTNDEWIVTRSGIRERRFLGEGETEAGLTAEAARRALQQAGTDPSEIDLVLLCTYTSRRSCPSLSCETAHQLGLDHVPAMDLNAACSGFIYGLHVADALVRTGVHRRILLVAAEFHGQFLDFTDRKTCVLMGDGAGAAVIAPDGSGNGHGVHSTWIGADTSSTDAILIDRKEALDPSAPHARQGEHPFFQMRGREVFKFAVRIVGPTMDKALELAGWNASDIDLLVMHQANIRIIRAAADRLGLPDEKVFANIEKYGNTAAASIPLALAEAVDQGRLHRGMRVVLVGFGAGFTYGAATLTW